MNPKFLKTCLIASGAIALAGCGNSYDGMYAAQGGFLGPLITIEIDGSKANITQIDQRRQRITREETWRAEDKGGEKLLLTSLHDVTYAFVRAVDDRGLECLNCGDDLPVSWQAFNPTK